MIPLVDLKKQYINLKKEIDSSIKNVIENTAFIKGENVKNFENNFSKILKSKYCISCANGTDALYITLKSLGIGRGDEVITAANSWISSSEAISQTGAKVVFADIEANYFTIDPKDILKKITKKTKAIIPVHLFGQSSDIREIVKLAKKFNLYVVEDCAQSHLGENKKKLLGNFGIAGTFSFYPGKNLGAFGDAGAIITNNKNLAIKMRKFANHGSLIKHNHTIEGVNSRMDGIQAAILNVKLRYLKAWNNKRLSNAKLYHKYLFQNDNLILPNIRKNTKHAFHLFVVRVNKRKKLINYLKENNISTGIHYPIPLPFLKAYKHLNRLPKHYPISWRYHKKILSLPMFPELSEQNIKFISNKINKFYS